MTPNMSTKQRNRVSNALTALPAGILAVTLLASDLSGTAPFSAFIGEAQARVGMPRTPVSFAGVARRTAVRRSAIYVNALPAACVRTSVSGTVVWRCGGTYYQAYGQRYVVVYVN
jgi:hypothetical protein